MKTDACLERISYRASQCSNHKKETPNTQALFLFSRSGPLLRAKIKKLREVDTIQQREYYQYAYEQS